MIPGADSQGTSDPMDGASLQTWKNSVHMSRLTRLAQRHFCYSREEMPAVSQIAWAFMAASSLSIKSSDESPQYCRFMIHIRREVRVHMKGMGRGQVSQKQENTRDRAVESSHCSLG